jgi:hypothetical protein
MTKSKKSPFMLNLSLINSKDQFGEDGNLVIGDQSPSVDPFEDKEVDGAH